MKQVLKGISKIFITIMLALVLMKIVYLLPWFQALMSTSTGRHVHVWIAGVFGVAGSEQADDMWMAIWFFIALSISTLLVFVRPKAKAT